MKKNTDNDEQRLYLGVDVGGTKVQSSLVCESGEIIGREKCPTPRKGGPERVVAAIEKCMDDMVRKGGITPGDLTAIGIAVPGVVDPERGLVVVAPNMQLTGVDLGALLKARFKRRSSSATTATSAPWAKRGSARPARPSSALYICVGTGIGSGLVQRGKLWRGDRESAGEIGHMIMQLDGPKCGCGGRGCFEALASRTAIERDLREAIAAGRKSVLLELAGGDLSVIRSGMIRKALDVEDELVTEVMRRAAEVLGLRLRQRAAPDRSRGDRLRRRRDRGVQRLHHADRGERRRAGPDARRPRGRPRAAFGLGRRRRGAGRRGRRSKARRPQSLQEAVPSSSRFIPKSPALRVGEIAVGEETYSRDIYISVGGRVKKRDEEQAEKWYGSAAHDRPQGVGKGLPRRAGSPVHRRRQIGQGRTDRRRPPLPGAAVDPVRNPADRESRRELQRLKAPQGRADPGHELTSG